MEPLPWPSTKRRFNAKAKAKAPAPAPAHGTIYSPYLRTTPSHPTLHPLIDNYHSGIREGQPSIDRELVLESNQRWMKTLTSSMLEPGLRVNAVDCAERSTDSHSSTNPSTWSDPWLVNKPASDTHRRPATGNAQGRPEAQEPGEQPLLYNPLFGIPKDGQIRENSSTSRNYGGNTRMADSGRAQIPVDDEQEEEPPLGTTPLNAEVEPPNTHAQTFQECVLVAVHELCTDAARRYWQTKRPRPQLVVDIPSSRATHRSAPHPERRRGCVPQTRRFHDPRRVLHWTRDEGDRGFVYPDSLVDLVWRISEQEWTQATERGRNWNDAGAHTECLTAVHRMKMLYDWAQTVIQALEKVQVDYQLLSLKEMTDVMLAARDMAVWLLADDEKNEIEEIWAHVIQVK